MSGEVARGNTRETEGSDDGKKPLLLENLMSVDEVAEALGVAPQTIRNWVALRSMAFIRVGRRTMFRPESVKAWIAKRERRPR